MPLIYSNDNCSPGILWKRFSRFQVYFLVMWPTLCTDSAHRLYTVMMSWINTFFSRPKKSFTYIKLMKMCNRKSHFWSCLFFWGFFGKQAGVKLTPVVLTFTSVKTNVVFSLFKKEQYKIFNQKPSKMYQNYQRMGKDRCLMKHKWFWGPWALSLDGYS